MKPDPRDVSIYRPYDAESPWPDCGEDVLVRVAKFDTAVVGAYRLRQREATVFELEALYVDNACRGAGLGRWLLGHALGLAESRGGRRVLAAAGCWETFLSRGGFQPDAAGAWCFTVTPE